MTGRIGRRKGIFVMRFYRAMIGFVAVAAVTARCGVVRRRAQSGGFSDVPSGHWAAASVQRLVSQGILAAPPKPTVKPAPKYDGDKAVTRYELAVALDRFVQYVERADKQKKSKFNVRGDPGDRARRRRNALSRAAISRKTRHWRRKTPKSSRPVSCPPRSRPSSSKSLTRKRRCRLIPNSRPCARKRTADRRHFLIYSVSQKIKKLWLL